MREAEQNYHSKLGVITRNTKKIVTVNMRKSLVDPRKKGAPWPKDYFNCCRHGAEYHSETRGDYEQRIRVSLHLEEGEGDISQGVNPSFNWIDQRKHEKTWNWMSENPVSIRNRRLSNKRKNITEFSSVGWGVLSVSELMPLGYDLINYPVRYSARLFHWREVSDVCVIYLQTDCHSAPRHVSPQN